MLQDLLRRLNGNDGSCRVIRENFLRSLNTLEMVANMRNPISLINLSRGCNNSVEFNQLNILAYLEMFLKLENILKFLDANLI